MKIKLTIFGMAVAFAAGMFAVSPSAEAQVLPLEVALQPAQTVTLDDEKSEDGKESKEEKKKRKAEERARKKEEREAKRKAKKEKEKDTKEQAEA